MTEKSKGGLVYSSEWGRMCPICEKPIDACKCKKSNIQPVASKNPTKSDGILRIGRETKGRKGAGVTIVSGFVASDDEIKKLAAELKKICGAGGAIKNGQIEIQGDHRDRIIIELEKRGYQAKRSGG